LTRDLFAVPAFVKLVECDLATGIHDHVTEKLECFTTAQFLRPEELEEEVTAADFSGRALVD
jgi:hypothetical protein